MKHNYQHNKKWFIDRIGKRIFRRQTTCSCIHCKEVENEGVIITDMQHAVYIHLCHNELGIKYYDKKPKDIRG